MFCAQCSEKILSDPIKSGRDYFCSVDCAKSAAGLDEEEELDYVEEEDLSKDYFDEFEE